MLTKSRHLGPYPAELAAIRDIRADLKAELSNLESYGSTIDDLLLAVTEIASNCIRHSELKPHQIDLEINRTPSKIELAVMDDGGKAAALAGLLDDAAGQKVALADGGMGLRLITSLFPDHHYDFVDGKNRLAISRALEGSFKPRIALIDDDGIMGQLLASYLRSDYDVTVHDDAEVALAAIITEPPDLIISDIDMPVMDGMALRRRLQTKPNCVTVPFIFLTGLEGQAVEDQASDLGIDEFVAKPVSKRRINGLVSRILRRSRQLRDGLAPQLEAAVINSLRSDLPASIHGYDLNAVERPAEVGGGDIVLLKKHDGYADLFLIDVMGHGLPAKLFAHLYAGFINGLVRAAPTQSNLSTFLAWLSEALQAEPALNQSFLTCLVMRLRDDGEIELASAGHPRPLLIDDHGKVEEIPVEGPLLGLGIEDYEITRVHLDHNQRVLAFTDGLIDGLGLTPANLKREIAQVWQQSPEGRPLGKSLLQRVDRTLELGHGHADDLTILTLARAIRKGGLQ